MRALPALAVLAACAPRPAAPGRIHWPTARHVVFAGRDWVVRPDGRAEAPGPNDWTDDPDAVWVDDRGALHLRLRQEGRRWPAVELHTDLPGDTLHLEIDVQTPAGALDRRAVAAVFVYRDDDHEIDLELSEWGGGNGYNAQYAVAPYGEGDAWRFTVPDDVAPVRHVLDWRADRVAMESRAGDRLLAEWRWTDPAAADRQGYRLHVNLWWVDGKPSRRGPVEFVIREMRIGR